MKGTEESKWSMGGQGAFDALQKVVNMDAEKHMSEKMLHFTQYISSFNSM